MHWQKKEKQIIAIRLLTYLLNMIVELDNVCEEKKEKEKRPER